MKTGKIIVGIQVLIRLGEEGGLEQTVLGLISALRELNDSRFHYHILVTKGISNNWLIDFTGENQTVVELPSFDESKSNAFRVLFGRFRRPFLGVIKRRLKVFFSGDKYVNVVVNESKGLYESLGLDVLHIIYPIHYVRTSLPVVLTMHDLQHRHLRYIFDKSRDHLMWREKAYPIAFKESAEVVAICDWVRNDIIQQYNVDEGKVTTVHWGAPTTFYDLCLSADFIDSVKAKYVLNDPFILYPAVTYEHKNHIQLIKVIESIYSGTGIIVNVVCTGAQKHHWSRIEEYLRDSPVKKAFRFTGFVDRKDLVALYMLSEFVVLPTLFEGAGLPILEAFHLGKPVVCSDIEAFREYGGDAPLFFNPHNIEEMSAKILRVYLDKDVRPVMINKGHDRIDKFKWSDTARMYNDVYMRAYLASRAEAQ